MNLYQITLPMRDNLGQDAGVAAAHWQQEARRSAGGYTRWPAKGAWVNEAGKLFVEPNMLYQVACDAETWAHLVWAAFKFFPDQEAIYWVKLGEAHVDAREAGS